MTVTDLVGRERRRIARLVAASGVAGAIALAALVLTGAVTVLGNARWLALPKAVPFIAWIGLGVVIAFGVRWTKRRLSRDASLAGIARAVEEERSLRVGSLRGILEVENTGVLGRLGAAQMTEKLREIRDTALAPRLRRSMFVRVGVAAAFVAIAGFALISRAWSTPDGLSAVLHPVRAWNGSLLEPVSFTGLPSSVLRGERVRLRVSAPGRRVITVAQRAKGASWRVARHVVANGSTMLTLGPVDADVTIYASDGRSASDTAVVRVVDRPFIGDVSLRAVFPTYLDRREETITLGEPVRVPRGTVLHVSGQSSTELRGVRLTREKDVIALTPDGRSFMGQVVAGTSGTFAWSAEGTAGAIADLPPALELEVLPDSTPTVEILAPAGDTTVAPGDTISLAMLATDDHAIANVALRTWVVTKNGQAMASSIKPLGAPKAAQWAGDTTLTIGKLEAGDALHVVVSASDLSPWNQIGSSRELVLRVPSLSEQREAARAMGDSAVSRAEAAAAAQKALQQRTAEASRQRDRDPKNASGKNDMSYESAQRAKELAREQRELADRVEQLQNAAQQMEKQLRQSGALDSALQERLREAQKLLREALTPELAEQLRKLEEASQNLSSEDARKALADMAEQQRRLREQLEKSVEMLKRAALEGQMQTLKDEASELAKRERQLADSMAKADQEEEKKLAEQAAKQIAEQSRDLQEAVKKLQERLNQERAESGAERVAQANQKVEESARQMEKAAGEQQQSGNQQKADSQQQKTGNQQQSNNREQQAGGQRQGEQGQRGEQQKQGQQSGEQQKNAQGQQQQQQRGASQQQANSQSGSQQSQQTEAAGNQGSGQKNAQQTADAIREAAKSMEQAAEELAKAREQQIGEWKKELTGELDRSIQEMIQLAREQDNLEKQARDGAPPNDLRSQQSALQQGVEKAGSRLQDASQKSSLLSQRSLRMVGDARRKVEDATRMTQQAQTSSQMASSMREASEALNQAAASLVRDRERASESNSASGFEELIKQLQQMARQQGALNQASQQLMPQSGQQLDQSGRTQARQLGRQQREVASRLEDAADRDESGRSDELAREARQIAQQLESAQLDASVLERQQRLFRKMLDAGRLLEEDEREDTGKREAKPWTGTEVFTPQGTTASGKAAARFQAPTWSDLRGLTPEERRLVLEYFKRINADRP